MPNMKDWTGSGSMRPTSDPAQKPKEGDVKGSGKGWNYGGVSERNDPDPRAKVPGQIRTPKGEM